MYNNNSKSKFAESRTSKAQDDSRQILKRLEEKTLAEENEMNTYRTDAIRNNRSLYGSSTSPTDTKRYRKFQSGEVSHFRTNRPPNVVPLYKLDKY